MEKKGKYGGEYSILDSDGNHTYEFAYEVLSRLVWEECHKRGDISQEEFAKPIGLSRSTISAYLTGRRFPSRSAIPRLSEGLGVSSDIVEALRPYKVRKFEKSVKKRTSRQSRGSSKVDYEMLYRAQRLKIKRLKLKISGLEGKIEKAKLALK